jgi:cytochrome c-type biogenesis protein CcmH
MDYIGEATMKAFNSILLTLGILFLALPSTAVDDVAAREAEAKHIETMLIAPCCWRQPVSDHPSDIASHMKVSIRQMLEEGKERQEILDFYVERYGARILSVPPQQGFNRMSFLMPVLFGIVAMAVVGVVLRKWSRSSGAARAAQIDKDPELDGAVKHEMSRRIQEELDKY